MTTGTTKAKPKAKEKDGDKLAQSVEKLSVEPATKVRSKNLNVIEEFRKSGMKKVSNFVVIGKCKRLCCFLGDVTDAGYVRRPC